MERRNKQRCTIVAYSKVGGEIMTERKNCPVCEGDMRKDCNCAETIWGWYCDDCGYYEPCIEEEIK